MKDTIKAKVGYKVFKLKSGENERVVYDGDHPLFTCEIKSKEWHIEEEEENEMYHIVEIFTTLKGNQFIYSRDEETDDDYIILFKKATV